MFLRNLIIYAVAGSVLWVIAQRLGAGIGITLAASLLLPPLALLSYITQGQLSPFSMPGDEMRYTQSPKLLTRYSSVR